LPFLRHHYRPVHFAAKPEFPGLLFIRLAWSCCDFWQQLLPSQFRFELAQRLQQYQVAILPKLIRILQPQFDPDLHQ